MNTAAFGLANCTTVPSPNAFHHPVRVTSGTSTSPAGRHALRQARTPRYSRNTAPTTRSTTNATSEAATIAASPAAAHNAHT
jgi:hypothetical protein